MRFFSRKDARSSPSPSATPPSVSAASSPSLAPVSSASDSKPPSYELSNRHKGSSASLAPSVSRQSSSSVLRSMASPAADKKKPKNVPYRPTAELQAHIDNLDRPAAFTAFSATTSSAHTEYFDVLPSFQMFQSILKRDDNQFSENLVVKPPEYGDVTNTSPTPPLSPSLTPVASRSGIDSILDDGTADQDDFDQNHDNEDYVFSDNEAQDGLRQARSYELHSSSNISQVQDTYGHTVLDNIDRLQKMYNSPIDIQVHVTKKVPVPHTTNELETRLKEYSDGDLVNGYVVITNTSDKPVSFGLFTVSLEGTIKATERNLNSQYEKNKFSKILMKKFLKMYDFNASYGYSHVPNSAGIEYEAFSQDQSDGCQLGLPNERILQPNTKYKKFFTFKFPNKLLDNVCSSGLMSHLIPPPSVGIDKTSFNGRSDTIELNKALGYGCLQTRGTPLMTRDYSFDNMSVSYAVEAKFIDKLNSAKQDPLNADDINTSNEHDYVISSSRQYFLRYIPNIQGILKHDSDQDILMGRETFNTVGISRKLYHAATQMNTWKTLNELNYMVEQEIDSRLTRDEYSGQDIKLKNLIDHNQALTQASFHNFDKTDQSLQVKAKSDNYGDRCMLGTRKPMVVKGKKKKKLLSSVVDVGRSRLFVSIPNKPLPYVSAKLLMKYNVSEDYEENDLAPVNSISSDHINDLYQRDDQEAMHSVEATLEFTGPEPPEISEFSIQVVAWTFRSDYPLPCKLEPDFFYSSPQNVDTVDDSDIIKENLQILKNQMGNYIEFLKENQVSISKDSFMYLKSMKTLGIKRDTIKDFFKNPTAASHGQLFSNDWQKGSDGCWRKNMNIGLEISNKNNITLIPNFQSCMIGRVYCLQVGVRYKGDDNFVKVEVPIIVG